MITIIIPGCELGNGTTYNLVAVQLASKLPRLPFTGFFFGKNKAVLCWFGGWN